MKLLKIIFLGFLIHVNTFASSDTISRRPLHAPVDRMAEAEAEDRVALLEREVQTLLGRVEVLERTVSQLRSGNANITLASQIKPSTEKVADSRLTEVSPNTLDAATNAVSVTPGDLEKKNYDAALLSLKDNKFDEAEAKFANFINKYPKSLLLSNAYFWHGETFFRRNNFEKAAISYLKGYKQFPKAAKAADSLLKLSLSLGSMGKTKEACAMLTKLEAEFKDRPANSIKRSKDARNKYGCSK